MSFNIYDSGEQVDETELYLFSSFDIKGANIEYGFTTGPNEIRFTPSHLNVGEVIFVPEAFTRGDMKVAVADSSSQISISFNPNNQFAKTMALGGYYNTFKVSVIKIDPAGGSVVRFWGEVTQSIYKAQSITLNCSSILNRTSQKLKNTTTSRLCPWSVYSSACGRTGLLNDIWMQENIVDIDVGQGIVTTANSLPFFDAADIVGGVMVINNPLSVEILDQPFSYIQSASEVDSGAAIEVTMSDVGFVKYLVGENPASVVMYKGCNKTVASCKDTFNNSENFGGFPAIPREVAVRT